MKASNNCRGQIEHGTGCTICGRCLADIARLKRENKHDGWDELVNEWEAAATAPDLKEIVRMARVGLWAERNSIEIDTALRLAAGKSQNFSGSKFEKVLASRPTR